MTYLLTGPSYDLTWRGRQLMEMSAVGGQFRYTFEYNADGIRTSKTSQGVKHTYTLNGTQILTEAWGSNLLVYLYDESGSPIGMQYRSSSYAEGVFDTYYFEKNLQGDIIAVYTAAGVKIGSYKYDAWGNCTAVVVSGVTNLQRKIVKDFNPFRYRGYYYDVETSLYYLQSRYYDPATGRFLNADNYVNANGDMIGFNMYGYCSNNSVIYKQGSVSSGGSVNSSSIFGGGSSSITGSSGTSSNVNPSAPGCLSIVVGAIPDFILGMQYLAAHGMHSKFAYATNTRYMHPIMGGTWRWFPKSSSNLGTVAQSTFKQILTGDARAGFGAIAKSVGKTVGVNALINFGFNLYENNWQMDLAMLKDTAIDTAIGGGSYYLASGTMSLVTAGAAVAGFSVPGVIVVGGVIILSVGFEHLIRAISGYWE